MTFIERETAEGIVLFLLNSGEAKDADGIDDTDGLQSTRCNHAKKNAALRGKTLRIISAIQTDRRKGREVLDLYRRCFKLKVGIKIYVAKISRGEHKRRTCTMKIYAYPHLYAEKKGESD